MKRKCLTSLSYLQNYGSSESEEETSTVDRQNRLPAPNLPSYKVCQSIMRDPVPKEGNNGKIRNFAHEPGNWSTYVYVPLNETEDITNLINDLRILLPELDLQMVDDFHISLTKTVILRHHWIHGFIDSINTVLAGVEPFFISLSGLKVYINENKTRTFVGLEVREGSKELSEIVKMLDKCLFDYNLPPFYDDPSFHVSLIWCVGDRVSDITTSLQNLSFSTQNLNIFEKICYLKCNSGNKKFSLNLSNKTIK